MRRYTRLHADIWGDYPENFEWTRVPRAGGTTAIRFHQPAFALGIDMTLHAPIGPGLVIVMDEPREHVPAIDVTPRVMVAGRILPAPVPHPALI